MTNTPGLSLSLISAPWALYNRPSIQLGALKAYLEQQLDCQVTALHPYLAVAKALGPDLYHDLALDGWGGEALFSALLFPTQETSAAKLFAQVTKKKGGTSPDFSACCRQTATCCDEWLAQQDFSGQLLVGFSLCFSQLFASLYLAKRVKERWPGVPIVFGGSSCGGEMGRSLMAHFPQVDYLVDGEGEIPLTGLSRYLAGESEQFPARVLARNGAESSCCAAEIAMSELPVPDYRPYMQQMRQLFGTGTFIPELVVEFSRGCWWNKCSFCNLNLQWQGYRSKSHGQMSGEITVLSRSLECLDFVFADNALPPAQADLFFSDLAKSGMDCRFFAEIRAEQRPERIATYRAGGLTTVQVGIEALSDSLLKRMRKGTGVMDNVAVLKLCLSQGIKTEGNLILEFPGSTAQEVTETLELLDFLLPFPPLDPATFFLGYGSPVYHSPAAFGLKAITIHPRYQSLLPLELQGMTLLASSYRGDRKQQRKLWSPVRTKLQQWRKFHQQRRQDRPALSYRDGGTFIVLRQERCDAPPLLHRLRGASRRIYLHCETPKTIDQLMQAFAAIAPEKMTAFLAELSAKRLLFNDGKQVLALAIREPGTSIAGSCTGAECQSA